MKNTLLSFLLLLGVAVSALTAQDLYDSTRFTEIKIHFEQPNWHHILDSTKMSGSNDRLMATVYVNNQKFENVGVRYKGNSSFKNPRSKGQKKLPLNLKADHRIKNQTFPGGYTTIKLSNVFQDPSFLREILSYEIAREYLPASRCNFAKVWVNGEYFGLYSNTQAVDEVFLKQHFGTNNGTFIKCDPEYELVKNKDFAHCPKGDKASLMYQGDDPSCYEGWYEMENQQANGWQELIRLIKLLNSKPEEIQTAINVDAVLWMHAFNNVLVNLDSYTGRLSHNYYLYRTPDSLFTPIVWDMNLSFGGFRWDGEKAGELTDAELKEFSLLAHYKTRNPKRPLITNLLANTLYRKIYIGHCRTIVNDWLANGRWLNRARQLQQLIDEEVKNDPAKLYSYDDFKNNLKKSVSTGLDKIIGLEELLNARTEFLINHPLFNGVNPEIVAVKHAKSQKGIRVVVTANSAENVYLVYRKSEQHPFKTVLMNKDTAQSWSYEIASLQQCQYYIIAEGERLAVCSPERSSLQLYAVKD